MNSKAKELRNEYMKQYRARNKQKIKEINNRYWEKRAEQKEQEGESQNEHTGA
jgi:hypothetical protein